MHESKSLYVFGVSYRTASLAVRESVCVDRSETVAALRAIGAREAAFEAALLSTCNRTELYVAAPSTKLDVVDRLRSVWGGRLQPLLRDPPATYHLTDLDAARHLCRVACGLDSAVIGDRQILGQVKAALRGAATAGTLSKYVHETFTRALRAGKRARQTTAIGRGAASVGAALVDVTLSRCAPHERDLAVVVVGAGKVAEQIVRHLTKRGVRSITVVNRTETKAERLARECGGVAAGLPALPLLLERCDVIISAVAATQPIIHRATLERALARRAGRRVLLVVDAGVPRNVEVPPGAAAVNVDSILERRQEGLAERRAAVPAVERLVDEAVAGWQKWHAAQPLETAIKALFAEVARISRSKAAEAAVLGGVTPAEAESRLAQSFKRQLHDYVRQVRAS